MEIEPELEHRRRAQLVALAIFVAVLATALALLTGASRVGKPFPGFLVQPGLYLSPYQISGSAGSQAGLLPGDVIRTMDGIGPSGRQDFDRLLHRIGPGGTVHYVVLRNGRELTIDVPVSVFGWRDFLAGCGGLILTGWIFFLVGLLSGWLRPLSTAALGIWAMGLTCGFFSTTYYAAHFGTALASLNNLAVALLGGSFLYVAAVFPTEGPMAGRVKRLLFPFSAVLGAFGVAGLILLDRQFDFAFSYGIAVLPSLWITFGMLTMIGSLPLKFRRAAKGGIDRQRLASCMLGAAFAFLPVAALWGIPFSLGSPAIVSLSTALALIAVFPASIIYAIVQQRLFEPGDLARAWLLYSGLTIALGLVYITTSTLASVFVMSLEPPGGLPGVVATAVSLGAFLPIRDVLQERIDRALLKGLPDATYLAHVAERLITCLDHNELAGLLLRSSEELAKGFKASMVLRAAVGELRVATGSGWVRADAGHEAVFAELKWGADLEPVKSRDGSASFPLRFQGQLLGYVRLEPASRSSFRPSALPLLKTLMAEAATAIFTAERASELQAEHEKLARWERLAALGTLATSVAHELTTPLAVLRGQIELNTAPLEPDVRERLARQILKLDAVVRSLLQFGGDSPATTTAVEVRAVIDSAVEAIEISEPVFRFVGFEEEVPDGLPCVMGSPWRLEQVIVNLLKNATHAVTKVAEPLITVSAGVCEGSVTIKVVDNGCGMDQQTISRIFEPFYSTKTDGKGSGLGLAVSAKLLAEMGATIEVESSPGRGTCVMLQIPVAEQSREDRG